MEEGEESAEAAAGKKRPSRANSTMGAERNFQSSSLVGGGEWGEGPSSASVGFTKADGEAILPARCAARAMGGEKSRDLHISGENVAMDEMMLNSSSSRQKKFTRQKKPTGIGLNAVLNFSDCTTGMGGAELQIYLQLCICPVGGANAACSWLTSELLGLGSLSNFARCCHMVPTACPNTHIKRGYAVQAAKRRGMCLPIWWGNGRGGVAVGGQLAGLGLH